MPWRKLIGATGTASDNVVKTLNAIDEVKKKIYLKEKCLSTIAEKNTAAEQENEETIHKLRFENLALREELQNYLYRDYEICVELFSSRPKAHTLGLRKKCIEEVGQDLDEAICSSKKHLNHLKYLKQLREEKLVELQNSNKYLQLKKEDNILARKYQLHTALDQVKQKAISARKIRDIYKEVHLKLEKEVRLYPRKMDILEKDKALLNIEDINIKQVHHNAITELESTLREKKEIEEKARQTRKERENILKMLKQTIKEYDPLFEEQRKPSFPFFKKPKRQAAENKDDAKNQRKKSEPDKISPAKIAEYENQANLLKSVTGIPLWNGKKMLWCLKNQMNIAAELEQQSKKKAEKVRHLQTAKEKLVEELDEIKYQDDRSFHNKVEELQSNTKNNLHLIHERKKLIRRKNKVADKATMCTDLILSHLIRTTSNFSISVITPKDDFATESDDTLKTPSSRADSSVSSQMKIESNFESLMEGVIALRNEASVQLKEFSLTAERVLEQPLVSKLNDVKLINDNNTRIPGLTERNNADEFDHYYANNEEYVTREMLKRHADMAVRASRRRY